MKANLIFDFIVDKENKTINIKREFDAEVSLVWDAYTKSEILDQWWGPKPWNARTKSMDFRDGGTWLYAMVGPNGEEHWSIAKYSSIKPQKSYTGVDGFTDAEGNINKDMPQSKWEVSFTPKGSSTIVDFKISYQKLEDLENIIKMGFKEGMTIDFEQLDELLPTLK